MEKIDFKRTLSQLYKVRKGSIVEVDVPAMNFLMIDGEGDPNLDGKMESALEALYSVAFGLKFFNKKEQLGTDFVVPPMEGLWWADDISAFLEERKNEWQWTFMIMQPDFITEELFEQIKKEVQTKKELPALPALRFESFEEGSCAQLLHIGPYSEEAENIQRLHSFINERGTLTGKHHEIYISDPRKTAPEKLRTILRQPFTK